ncbi:MAG: hypothetical protein FWF94_03315 [Oscillospiraceae bacterium]|nr:hypothetical protein [Oscillospiraceae bacterium]
MLLDLVNAKKNEVFCAEMEQIKEAYITGKYNGMVIPFAKQWKSLFDNKLIADKNARITAVIGSERCVVKGGGGNDNTGHFNHVCNVVAAMAHILSYAEQNEGIKKLTEKYIKKSINKADIQQRNFNCMVSALYHDVGKTIIDRRHPVEGKALFAGSKASVTYRFNEIAASCKCKFTSLNLSYYSEMIGAHDIHGTISTGENGLLSLARVIGRFESLFNDDKIRVKSAVFDLWLLNLADIIVSLKDPKVKTSSPGKWNEQEWQYFSPGNKELNDSLDSFFKTIQGINLMEDLHFALEIADNHSPSDHAMTLSVKQAAHRLQRLVRQSLGKMLEDTTVFSDKEAIKVKNAVIKRLDDEDLIVHINEVLYGEFGDNYGKMFGTMLQFDYALGFFQELAKQAIFCINEELDPTRNGIRTGWMYNKRFGKTTYKSNFLVPYNAECIVNNYIMVIASIFGEIYRMTANIENWNIEFEDAKNRLVKSKTKSNNLLYFDGIHRAGVARHLLIKELMLYKS